MANNKFCKQSMLPCMHGILADFIRIWYLKQLDPQLDMLSPRLLQRTGGGGFIVRKTLWPFFSCLASVKLTAYFRALMPCLFILSQSLSFWWINILVKVNIDANISFLQFTCLTQSLTLFLWRGASDRFLIITSPNVTKYCEMPWHVNFSYNTPNKT